MKWTISTFDSGIGIGIRKGKICSEEEWGEIKCEDEYISKKSNDISIDFSSKQPTYLVLAMDSNP